MKKIIGIITILVLMFLLISCQQEITHQEVYDEIKINYETGDSQDRVTKDFEFIYEERKSVVIELESKNKAITIVDNKGIVNPQITDTFVDVIISITINNKSENFIMTFKVIKNESLKVLILEATDFDYVIGEELPDYKNNFTATLNGVDVKHLVAIDDSDVNFDLVGVYEIKYKFTLDDDVIVKTIKVTVKEESPERLPVITGAKDFTYIIGEDLPSYLEGVTAVNYEGEEVNVSVDDSSVDLTKEGNYPLYFIAIDSHDNERRLEKEVRVVKPIYTIPPVISGAKDFIYFMGEDTPNYLEGVTALDENNDELEVEVYDNLVDLTKKGTYTIFFVATDSSGNRTTIEKTVTVKENVTDITPPVITGAKDFIYIIGEDTPNYLRGVKALDNIDGEVSVNVDDSEVNLSKEGVYSLYFIAIDSSNNETRIKREVTVIDASGTAETIVETFDNLPLEDSQYLDGSFIGVNGIGWSFYDSRTDLHIDGRSLTFGAKTSAKLSATLEEGLSYFSLDAKTEFSGDTVRNISLYINDEEIAVFGVTSEVQTFKVENLSYEQLVQLEIRNVDGQRVSIDNVTLSLDTRSLEEKILDIRTDNLSIPTIFRMETEVDFLTEIEEVNLVWEHQDSHDINNQYVNLITGLITIPEGDVIVHVKVKVTLTYSGFEREKIFTLDIGEGEPISIQEVRTVLTGSQVKTKGIITSSVLNGNIYYGFMQDDNSGIYIESTIELIVGNEVVIKGVKKVINGVVTLVNINEVRIEESKTFNIAIVNLDELNNYLGQFIQAEGYLTKDTTSNQTQYEIVTLDGLVKIQLPSYIDQTILQSLLNGKEAGSRVSLEGYVYKKDVIYLINEENLYIEDVIDDEAVGEIILASIDLPLNNDEILDDIILPTTDMNFNSIIEWLSSEQSVISDTGKVTLPEEDTQVTLYYEIKVGSNSIKTGNITVVVLANIPLLSYYQGINGKTGNDLFLGLRNIISNRTITSYDRAKDILEISDRDPDNHNNVILIYNRTSVQGPWSSGGTIWNREHVWPQSFLSGNQYQDPHNIRPANPGVNTNRQNYAFAPGSGSHGVVTGGWYPGDEDRGDVARIMFYMITLYTQLNITTMGSMEMFIEWHYADPVDDFERNRNDVIYSYTNNRNPFIDHPHFASLIWDSTTYSSKKLQTDNIRAKSPTMEGLYN